MSRRLTSRLLTTSATLPLAPLSAQDAVTSFADQQALYEEYKDIL